MSLKKMSGNIEIHVIAGEKCQDIWNKPGGLMDPSGLFSGVSISPLHQLRNLVDMSGRIW